MMRRVAITVRGVVQGVGFRPFVYRVATEHGLSGWVRNRSDGVRIEIQGPADEVDRFLRILKTSAPPQARIDDLSIEEVEPGAGGSFEILASESAAVRPSVPADLATCPECLAEIASPAERRHGYAFTNCTNCGPRYSIIESLPYDRPRTSMKSFPLCEDCEREYRNPLDRRFHAQPVACPKCGPQLSFLLPDGRNIASGPDALLHAARAVLDGSIIAIKGLGGFQVVADATDPGCVGRLRQRKHREAKPFAVMFPTLESLRAHADVSADEAAALQSPQAPILLVRRASPSGLAPEVAPGNPRIGAMLPYTPLHRLLLDAVARPLVCTSGNLSDEPMCIETDEALRRLAGIAGGFLVHDRPVVRPIDDSVARLDAHGLTLLRRARGFAPLPLPFLAGAPPLLAVGGHLKCTVALSVADQIVLSQHLGDLDSAEGAALHARTVDDLTCFFQVRPRAIACDLHPEYASTRLAERLCVRWGVPLERVQHHHAHVAAVLAEHGIEGEVLGLAWDGTGYGDDGTLWGGEALVCDGAGYRRFFPLRPFPLPGGDLAAREPRRAALGLLFAVLGPDARGWAERWFDAKELRALLAALERGLHAPATTSIGRLFDAMSALCGLRARSAFEGQAAMDLEFSATGIDTDEAYSIVLDKASQTTNYDALVREALDDVSHGTPAGLVSARFHNALAELAVALARQSRLGRVVLAGGCFQNERLARLCTGRLEHAGFEVLRPVHAPPNDGALALGQALVAARRLTVR